ncbi:unnamed protein product [Brassica oleracea var. botrytis]
MPSCSERKIVWILCLIFFLSYPIPIFASSPTKNMCHAQGHERDDALWEFKSEFHLNGMAASEKTLRWRNNTNCCSWDGIICDPKTDNVAELNLFRSSLNGSLRSNNSLFRLEHLQSLDLSSNNLAGILPDSIGNLKNLRILESSKLSGNFPQVLPNLTELITINLHFNQLEGTLPANMRMASTVLLRLGIALHQQNIKH